MGWFRRRGEAQAATAAEAVPGSLADVAPVAPTTRAAVATASAITLGLTALAIGLAWAGQAQTTRNLYGAAEPLAFLSAWFDAFKNGRELSASMLLLLAGAAVLGYVSLRAKAAPPDAEMFRETRPFPFSSPIDGLAGMFAISGLAVWALFLYHLHDERYTHPLNFALLFAVVALAAPLIRRDLTGRRFSFSFRWLLLVHLAFLVATMCSFLYLNARDLESWKYAGVGDEYNNYEYALRVSTGVRVNLWSHVGADALFSNLGAYGQAAFLKIGEGDNFAWKFFSVFIAAVAFPSFYFLMRELFTTRVAVIAAILLACSHYLFGYAHHFLYLDGMLPTVTGLWLLVVGLRRDSSLALFGAGIALAFGFYTFESGRAAVAVAAIFMLTFGIKSFRPAVFVPLAGGFLLLIAPLFASDGIADVFDQMFGQSAVSYDSSVTGNRLDRVLTNVQFSFVSFNYLDSGRHYVWGSLADPVTAALYVLGLGVVLVRVNRPAYRLILIWWIVEVAANGFTHPYPTPPISRMHAVVPPVAALAALAVDTIIRAAGGALRPRRVSAQRWDFAIGAVAVAALFPLILYLNLHRFWYEYPRNDPNLSNETALMRAYQDSCMGKDVVIIHPEYRPLLQKIIASYKLENPPTLLFYEEGQERLNAGTLGSPDCIIVGRGDAIKQSELLRELDAKSGYRQTLVFDLSNLRSVFLYLPPESSASTEP